MLKLEQLVKKYPTDKESHGYLSYYQHWLQPYQFSAKKVLEIGLFNGNSQLMWQEFFPNAEIYALDNLEFKQSQEAFTQLSDQIHIKAADQANREDLKNAILKFGGDFDVIIDDGGHLMDQQQISLGYLFTYLNPNGIYIIEDLHTSFMPHAGINQESSNKTYHLLKEFKEKGQFNSPHLTHKEKAYLETTISACELVHPYGDNNHITSAIKKKGATSSQDICVVYYAYLNPAGWEKVVAEQLQSLSNSGLPNASQPYIVLCGSPSDTEKASALASQLIPNAILFKFTDNNYEYSALDLVWKLAQATPERLFLYFHSKGVVRGNGQRSLEEKKLFSEVVMPWQKIRDLFVDKHINKVGYAASPSGFCWYNFWWARGSYLAYCQQPHLSSNRHDYESWVHRMRDGTRTGPLDCYSLATGKLGDFFMPDEADQLLLKGIDKFKENIL